MDWIQCSEVEQNPEKVGGAPILKGSRVQAELILLNAEDGLTGEEIAELYTLPPIQVNAVLRYAKNHR